MILGSTMGNDRDEAGYIFLDNFKLSFPIYAYMCSKSFSLIKVNKNVKWNAVCCLTECHMSPVFIENPKV